MVWNTTQTQSYAKYEPGASPESRPRGACGERGAAVPPSGLMNDRDLLLILGLILVLMSERADRNLILALAFVLLM